MSNYPLIQVAILDDYQDVALQIADWSSLEGKAHIVSFQDHLSDAKTLIERLKPFDVICVMRECTPLPRSILEQLPHLKLISSTGKRNASIDLSAAQELGITACHTGYTSHGAVELTWCLILAIARNLCKEVSSMKEGKWQTTIGGDLQGKTLGILGLGSIGGSVTKIAKAFGMKVVAWSPNLNEERAKLHEVEYVSKKQLFEASDMLTIHLVYSAQTYDIISTQELSWMKETAYLINTSRGQLVNENALIEALHNKKIAGAALDVYNIEPLPKSHPFRSMDNVIATPHIGFVTKETYKIFYRDTIENIQAWLVNQPIRVMREK